MTTLKIKKKVNDYNIDLIRNKAFGKEQIEEICDSKRTVQLDKLQDFFKYQKENIHQCYWQTEQIRV